ncbi:MAG TPA: hypothetical protein VFW65_18115 [Pseudonocardiaceae bacterium]|nr:hypothetical protein [Pseudonocardiaceae bacterium]
MAEIVAKVAALVSDTQLAINAGTDQGVKEGYTAYLFRTVTVNDPDTQEDLGSVRLVKLNLRVSHVQKKLCVAAVTDFETKADPFPESIASVRSRKRVTTSRASQVDGRVVLVRVGEEVILKEPPAMEPPF